MPAILKPGFGVGGLLQATLPPALQMETPGVSLTGDEEGMLKALRAAMAASGVSPPNPTVGAVISDARGVVRATGATEKWGLRHGERVALAQWDQLHPGESLKDATLHVLLEPCAHTGRQPPCLDAVLERGFRRVVVARKDPFPQVAGQSVARLKAAGLEVREGVLHAEATAWNLPFLAQLHLGRPLIACKWAQTLDGCLAEDGGASQWITGPAARSYTHFLRQKYDAILVGAGTVLADRPSLTARDGATPHHRNPLRLVWDRNGQLPLAHDTVWASLVTRTFSPEAPTVLFTPALPPRQALAPLAARTLFDTPHVRVVELPVGCGLGTLPEWLKHAAVSELLGGRPLQSVMVEGGASVLNALAAQHLMDVAHVFLATGHLGGTRHRVAPHPSVSLAHMERRALLATAPLGSDVLIETLSHPLTGLFQQD